METIKNEQQSYYAKLLILAAPLAIQHLIAIGLNLVDNVMVGRLGELPLAAVGSANQLFTLYSNVLFGLFSGAAVLLAQYYGARDYKRIRMILGMDMIIAMVLAVVTFILTQLFAPQIIYFFADEVEVIEYGVAYLRIVAFTFLTTAVSFAISFNCRSIQQLTIPTIIQIISILTNTALNYTFIYGHFGAPAMGVEGAAIATLISRILEMAMLLTYIIRDKEHPFHGKLSEYFGFTRDLFRRVLRLATPVLISEGGWSLGVMLVFAAYGKISAEALAVVQAGNVLCSFCQCTTFAVGGASAAIIGEFLGRNQQDEAFDFAKKYMRVQWIQNFIMTAMILLLRRPIAIIFDFEAETTDMLMLSLGVFAFSLIPRMISYSVQCGILRAGGDTLFCMVVELICNLGIEVVLAYASVLAFHLPLHWCIAVASLGNLIKTIIQYGRFYSKKWIQVSIHG